MRAAAVHPGDGHRLPVRDQAHAAVARREVDFRVAALDGQTAVAEIQAEELPLLAAELSIPVVVADLPVPLGRVAAGDEDVRLAVVEFRDDLGGRVVLAPRLLRGGASLLDPL